MTQLSKQVEIEGSTIHYLEEGAGDPILFLHGVPTSSYVWREIMPYLSDLGRCIAPDLIGFGESAKPNIHYTIADHIRYITQFIEILNLKRLTLVLHGWGSIIGFEYAMQHPENCKGMVFYEAFLRALNEDNFSLAFQEQLSTLQHLETNPKDYVTGILTQQFMGKMTEQVLLHYCQPFQEANSLKPIKQCIKELQRESGNNGVNNVIQGYSAKLMQSNLPKLMLYSIPGFITTISDITWAKKNLPNIEIMDIGEELHLAQESRPQLIGETISAWMQANEQI